VLPPADSDHAGRHVDSYRADPIGRQPCGYVARSTPQVGNGCAMRMLLDEGPEQGPIQGLVGQLVAELSRISLGEGVVASANAVVEHRDSNGRVAANGDARECP
jgi:hypothetical protein